MRAIKRSPLKSCILAMAFLAVGCNIFDSAEVIQRDRRTGLTENEAAQVLATVGDVQITLGEYAESLLRMGEYKRLRYQSKERQIEFLQELIDLELFAQEARRLGLDKNPEVELAVDQAQRDQVLTRLRAETKTGAEIPEQEVKTYYDSHRDEFKEPERRRVLAIHLKTRSEAEKVLKIALKSDGVAWGQLAQKYASTSVQGQIKAEEYSGDLGFTSNVGIDKGRNERVPEAVAAAVFELRELGEVSPAIVEVSGQFYIVRLGAISPARDRSFNSAAPVIRVELARQKYLENEKKLVSQLRELYPVQILP